jgi:hypothetical protein
MTLDVNRRRAPGRMSSFPLSALPSSPLHRSALRLLVLPLLLVFSVAVGSPRAWPASLETKPRQEEAAAFFASTSAPLLRIRVAQTNLLQLRRNARAYVRATVTEGNRTYTDVGVHLKGAAGSFRPVDDSKPAFTLNFDKFIEHQNFHGIDKLALNNSVQDGTYLTEAICAELFLAAGVPTPRATHARVEFNGRDMGLFVLKEGFDKAFLRRHFKNTEGNLYDGGFLREITEPLERTSGDHDVANRADLKALAAAALVPDPTARLAQLEKVLDVDRFLTFCVLEMFTWHWDGYTLKKNNYRIYHDPGANKLVFMPHGMDQMFWDPNGRVIPGRGEPEGLVARALLDTAEGQRRYRQRALELSTNVFTPARITNLLEQLQKRIQPALAAMSLDQARQQGTAATNLLNNILARIRHVRRTLSEPEPVPLRLAAGREAPLRQWQALDLRATGRMEETSDSNGKKLLHIAVGPDGKCTASWRTKVLLRGGTYVFSGRARTAGVVPLLKDVNTKGVGAGLRQSQLQIRDAAQRIGRKQGLVGDQDWQTLEYEFVVNGESDEVALVCELRAEKGEAWFDLDSLKLRRQPASSTPSSPVPRPDNSPTPK